MENLPTPSPVPPDDAALAYLDYASDAVVRQIVTAQMNGEKFPAFFFLPPPPRPYDLQLVQAFIPYLFATQYEGAPVPEIRFTSKEPEKIR